VRGKETGRSALQAGANSIQFVEYENVVIARASHAGGGDDIKVTFKNAVCTRADSR
jgi:hypothetical protein